MFKAPLTLKNPSHSIKSISKTTSTRTTAVYLEDTLTSDEIDAANKKQLLMAETFEKLQDLGANYGECWMITWIMNFPFVVSLPFSEDFSAFFPLQKYPTPQSTNNFNSLDVPYICTST